MKNMLLAAFAALVLVSCAAPAQQRPAPPGWWLALTAEQRAICEEEGGCHVISTARMVVVARQLAERHPREMCGRDRL